jgi:hypothetical protein
VVLVKLLAGIGFDFSQSAWLVRSGFDQVRFLKSVSWCPEKVLASLRQFFWSGQFVQSRLWQVVAFARSASLPKSFIAASQVIFFASVVVSFGRSNWVLPKSEFVVKCGQEGCGSGFWSRSLAQPENA